MGNLNYNADSDYIFPLNILIPMLICCLLIMLGCISVVHCPVCLLIHSSHMI